MHEETPMCISCRSINSCKCILICVHLICAQAMCVYPVCPHNNCSDPPLRLQTPPSANIAVPGSYMLFILSNKFYSSGMWLTLQLPLPPGS